MQLIDVLNKLRAIENPTEEIKEAIAQAESMTNEAMVMICKDCGDKIGHPTTDCPHDCHDPKGKHWIMSDVQEDEDVVVDMPVMVEPEAEPEIELEVEPDRQDRDEAVDMAHGQLEFIKYAAQEIEDYLMRGMPLPEWMQNKLSRMHGNIMNLHAYIEGEEGKAGLNESEDLSEMIGYYTIMKDGQVVARGVRATSEQDAIQQAFMKMGSASKYSGAGMNSFKAMRESEVIEAAGEFAQPFYDLLDDYAGGEQVPQPWATIIDSIVGYMSGDEIADFVDTFRREHDMNHPGEDDEYGEDDPNFESIDGAVEETVEIPVSELQDLLALAGIDSNLEEYVNTPDGYTDEPIYGDAEEQLNGQAGGLNRPKNQHSTAKNGDNAMAVESIKERLWAALQEEKEETAEGRGRGKDKVMAGRGKGKDKVMAGRGRGKN
jgi:hypothetical protein